MACNDVKTPLVAVTSKIGHLGKIQLDGLQLRPVEYQGCFAILSR